MYKIFQNKIINIKLEQKNQILIQDHSTFTKQSNLNSKINRLNQSADFKNKNWKK
jgi:hypothetical protein